MYITEEERKRCKKVAEAFVELYELTDIFVADAGKYGFIKLQYYALSYGFENVETFTDSRRMFDDLWEEWFNYQVLTPVLGTPLAELDYEEIFQYLPEERQNRIMERWQYFKEKSCL